MKKRGSSSVWGYEQEIDHMKLGKDLYAYLWQNPYENNCNTYVIDGEMTVLIDPGHSRHVHRIFFTRWRKMGFSSEEIDLVILTHSHPDHFEGLEAFLNKPIKIAMNQEEERYLQESGKLLFEMMGQPMPNIPSRLLPEGRRTPFREEDLSYLPDPRPFSWIPFDLLAGKEGPLYRGSHFSRWDWKDRLSGGKFQALNGKY